MLVTIGNPSCEFLFDKSNPGFHRMPAAQHVHIRTQVMVEFLSSIRWLPQFFLQNMYEVRADAFLSRIVDLMLGCINSPILKNTKHIYHVVDQKRGGGVNKRDN